MKFWLGTLMAVMALGTTACGDDEGETSGGGGGDGSRTSAILALTGDETSGSTVYDSSCGNSSCHGPDGSGSASNARDLNTVVPTIGDERLVEVIIDGVSANGGVMPGLGNQLDDQDIADVVAYSRATFDP